MTMTLPLRIADFTIHAAGPFCTHMLSQLGAECIKIESSLRLDAFRKPHPVYGRFEAATFDQVTANKLSVRVNLKHPEGVALARRVVAISDLTAESFRPGVMKRLGLGYEALREIKPDLVMVSVSSSGQTGPESHFAGYAPLFGAWGGLGYLSGYRDGPPLEMRHVMDHSVGFHAALAAMAALYERRHSGQGRHVDVSARDVAVALCGEALLVAAAGQSAERLGNGHGRMAPHGLYLTRDPDRWISIAIGSDKEWHGFLSVLGESQAARDPRFASQADRHHNSEDLDLLVGQWIAQRDGNLLTEALQREGVPAHMSWNAQDIVSDPHMAARGAILSVQASKSDARPAIGPPARFSKTIARGITRGTPALGQDEDYVFGELLGMGRKERRDLETREVII